MKTSKNLDFYKKYSDIRSSKGLKWSAFGDLLGMTPDAMRVAFNRKSLKEYEKDIIENSFGEKKSNKINENYIADNLDEILKNPLVSKEVEIKAIKKAVYWVTNPKDFEEYLNS